MALDTVGGDADRSTAWSPGGPVVGEWISVDFPQRRLASFTFTQGVSTSFATRALVSVDDVADRPARALADGEDLRLGRRTVRWFDTPHVPHGWDGGLMIERTTRTFLCGDLFTQPGSGAEPLTEPRFSGMFASGRAASRAPGREFTPTGDTRGNRATGARDRLRPCSVELFMET